MALLLQIQLIQVLTAFIAGSGLGVGAYGFCRWMERRFSANFYSESLVVLVFVALSLLPLLFFWFVFTSGLAIFGGWLHRRSGGASASGFAAFMTANASTSVSFVLALLILWLLSRNGVNSVYDNPETVFALSALIFPTLAPLAFWVWNSSRVRPGVDEAFEQE